VVNWPAAYLSHTPTSNQAEKNRQMRGAASNSRNREFETHSGFPFARKFAAKIRIFPRSVFIGCPSVVQKKSFRKNEAKLCPSLLNFFKRQSQIEAKLNPNEPTDTQFEPKNTRNEPKLEAPNPEL
jgi:hypothetical protein